MYYTGCLILCFYFAAGARLFEEQCVKDHSVPSQCGDCGEIGVKTGTRVSVKPSLDCLSGILREREREGGGGGGGGRRDRREREGERGRERQREGERVMLPMRYISLPK